jgi:hypothetical protein
MKKLFLISILIVITMTMYGQRCQVNLIAIETRYLNRKPHGTQYALYSHFAKSCQFYIAESELFAIIVRIQFTVPTFDNKSLCCPDFIIYILEI